MPAFKTEDDASTGSRDEGSNFRGSFQIDMKGLVGDAVGNVSVKSIHPCISI